MLAGLGADQSDKKEIDTPLVDRERTRTWTKVFWMFLAFHFTVWTVVPSITAPNQTLDALEMVGWGTQWQWGYYKHPPLPAWIAQAVTLVFGNSNFPLYATAALASSVCMWSAFVLGRRIVGDAAAMMASVALEASHYFSYSSVEFNNNVVSRAMAALAMVSVYKAMRTQRVGAWLLSGALIGLGFLAKYDVAIFAMSLLMFALIDASARKHWTTLGPYVMVFSALIVSGPHWVWAYANDFPTLKYVSERSASVPSIWNHATNPIYFCLSQMIAVLPVLAFLVMATRANSLHFSTRNFRWGVLRQRYNALLPDARFVLSMVFGGVAIVVLLSLITGAAVRSMWGSCLWTFSGLAIMILLQQSMGHFRINDDSARRAASMAVAVCVLMATALGVRQAFGPEISGKASRVHFPGDALSERIETAWAINSDTPLPVVIGDHWLSNNVIFYGNDRPVPYISGCAEFSPWINDDVVQAKGGIVLWQGERPTGLLSRFHVTEIVDRETINYQGYPDLPPLEISYAIVTPIISVATEQRRSLRK